MLTITAPAGYGKSTFAIQWASRSQQPVAWMTLDESDADPVVLLATISAALAHATPSFVPLTQVTAEETIFVSQVLPQFTASVAAIDSAVTVVFDDVQMVTGALTQRVFKALVDALPIGSQVAFVGRSMRAIPLPLWRGQGRVAELHAEDLTFSHEETLEAFAEFGRQTSGVDVHEATAGWPVAVFLLSQTNSPQSLTNISEFIETEVLAAMTPELRYFVMCTAAVGTVNPELAAVVSGEARAGRLLSEAVTTVLMAPTDQGWYRYHPLMQDAALDVWSREDPEGLSRVQAAAARWYLDAGMLETAVTHAIASADGPTLAPVVWEATKVALLQGRTKTALTWLSKIDPRTIDAQPALSMAAAWTNVPAGRYALVLRHLAQTLALMPTDWRDHPGDFSIGAELTLLLALSHYSLDTAADAVELGRQARALIRPSDPLYPLTTLVLAVNEALVGSDAARGLMTQAAALAEAGGIPSTHVEALSLLGILLIGQGDQTTGCDLTEQAMETFAFHDLAQMTSTWAMLTLANVALASIRGRDADVREAVSQQQAVAGEAEKMFAWYRPLSAGILAYASVRLGDLGRYQEYITLCDGPGLCSAWAARAEQSFAAATPLTQLTPAELRVWELLKSRMTLNEIAGALFLSRETVKSHTGAIYRKLGVASRREAQDLAESWG